MKLCQRGTMTQWAALAVALLLLVCLVGATIGGALVTKRRAALGADLAALAGATAVQRGHDGCLEAASTARANDVTLDGCRLDGEVVVVSVSRSTPTFFGKQLRAQAEARAGP